MIIYSQLVVKSKLPLQIRLSYVRVWSCWCCSCSATVLWPESLLLYRGTGLASLSCRLSTLNRHWCLRRVRRSYDSRCVPCRGVAPFLSGSWKSRGSCEVVADTRTFLFQNALRGPHVDWSFFPPSPLFSLLYSLACHRFAIHRAIQTVPKVLITPATNHGAISKEEMLWWSR